MNITLTALAIYFLIVVAFGIFSAFALDHLFRYGWPGDYSKLVAFFFFITSGAIIFSTLLVVLLSILGD